MSGQTNASAGPSAVNNSAPSSDNAAVSAFLRRRSGQMTDSPPLPPSNPTMTSVAGGSASPSGSTIANRRQASRTPAQHQSDISFSLTSLSPPSTPPMPSFAANSRSTTPTPMISSPLASPFGRQRAADEVRAVTNMLKDREDASIQRPASAPPRGRRSRRPSRTHTFDDACADALEKAPADIDEKDVIVKLSKRSGTTLSEIASETIEQFAAHLSDRSLTMLFLFIVAWGATLSLDRLTTYSYQTIATNSFAHHSSLAEVNVIRAVVAAVAAIPFATIADLGGRAQAFTLGLILYACGHAAMAGSTSIPSYVGGIVLYELGANGLVCLQNTVLADMTSSRNRLFFQIIPQMPFLVFSFVSSDIYSAILPRWRWGIGMFAILAPATLLPVIAILGHSQQSSTDVNPPARRMPTPLSVDQTRRRASLNQSEGGVAYVMLFIRHVCHLGDVIGLLLLAAALSLTLIPLTLAASSSSQWENPKILGMISAGIVLFPIFGLWEMRQARNPIISKVLLRNKTFWGGAMSLSLLWTAHALMLAYFPTYLYVVHGVSNRAQQNFSVIYSFTVAAASLPIALMVRHARRFKVFALIGVIVFTGGLGMMIGYRGTIDSNLVIIFSQIIIGVGGAMTISLIQAAVQVSVAPAFVAQCIAALNIFPCVGNAIGAAVAGAMWSNLLPGKLARSLTPTGHINELTTIYAEPLTWIDSNPLGSSTRTAVVSAYSSCWRVMMITATAICIVSVLSVGAMRNLRLNDTLSAEEAVGGDVAAYGGKLKPSKLATKNGQLFGDGLFERVEGALGRTLIRRLPKQNAPDSPTDIRADAATRHDRAFVPQWSSWSAFKPSDGSLDSSSSKGSIHKNSIPSPIDEVSPDDTRAIDAINNAPILVVEDVSKSIPRPSLTPTARSQNAANLSPIM